MQNKGPYYITTAIAYTSGKPHIGNTYEIIMADAIARWKRLEGYDVHFQTGSDEHGQKIEERAKQAGKTPKEFVDETAGEIKRIWDLMNTSYDRFIRTTDEDHERQVQKIFKKLYDQGDIYLGDYEGMYCTECEAFYTKSQLVDGDKCPVCGSTVHEEKEKAYFFRMSKYAPKLIDYINTHPEFIQPVSRKNEMMNNFLLPGLQDLCVSRTSFSWGIPVDFDPKHVVYVWLDALTNYITGIGYDADGNSSEMFKKYWPADLHLIGKDIIRFHTIYWPIFLMALGLPLPKKVFGHPWLLQGGEKMSKSKGNVIYADDLAELYGVDAVRYFCLHEMPYENDGVITWDLMTERTNSDLANTLGNLVNRTIAMSNKYFGGVVADKGAAEAVDDDLKAVVTGAFAKVKNSMDTLHVADALTEIFTVYKRLNKYIDETEPWVLARDETKKDRLATVLYNLTEGIVMATSMLAPFLPDTAKKIFAQLNAAPRDFDTLGSFGLYKSGTKVTDAPEILFMRKDPKEIMEKVAVIEEKQRNGGVKYPEVEKKPEITIDDFSKVQLQVGEVLKCEPVKKSKKLLVSQIRIGNEVRQIVSGIRGSYKPEDMVGKKVVVVTNLKPAKLCGVESQGMILAAMNEKGEISVLTLDRDMIAGTEVG
ncbi:MAG: methionine--tRNA ligase [Lachnospiraceae bacterium]|jgi:methionyl-tRNA synthetase|nr:methionine--tRNA ligase [Lachnospiraceae bacterium]MCH4032207.1 methionine--tRNA ligase [Lachnospiraceae bacterium]MCH4108915.1 methionine--tRNA ligase [Lachnospiraceae bacterium]MCI1332317.1 methionine--tRNA ligase [Lachnospiraceae bacterium]MCI1361732.1 methionine--tRNA ligase [Lachnospiraceae bacterium]